MYIQIIITLAMSMLIACQAPNENSAAVKGYGDGSSAPKVAVTEVADSGEGTKYFQELIECTKDIMQNRDNTLRETHNDPSCDLTKSNCVNWVADLNENANIMNASRGKAMQVDVKSSETSVYQRFTFSSLEACECMKKSSMTLGLAGTTSNVRVGLGDYAANAPSDRYTLTGVDQVLIQLLPDHEGIEPVTYGYCRLKITGYTFPDGSGYKKYDFDGDDGKLVPQEGSTPTDGFTTAEGDMHDQVKPISAPSNTP